MIAKVVLVGMMATGKTTVGRIVADRLDVPFVDLDAMVEEAAGCSVADVFAADGEAAFRDREAAALADTLGMPGPAVVATGGGVVERDDNRVALRAQSLVVWLRASPDVLAARAAADGGPVRPLLADDPVATLAVLDERRAPLYRHVADFVLDGSGLDPAALAAQIVTHCE